jgi:hypothetical protein
MSATPVRVGGGDAGVCCRAPPLDAGLPLRRYLRWPATSNQVVVVVLWDFLVLSRIFRRIHLTDVSLSS